MMSGNIRKKKEIVKIELESRDKQEVFNIATKTNEKRLVEIIFSIEQRITSEFTHKRQFVMYFGLVLTSMINRNMQSICIGEIVPI
jgi:hypothetical protein